MIVKPECKFDISITSRNVSLKQSLGKNRTLSKPLSFSKHLNSVTETLKWCRIAQSIDKNLTTVLSVTLNNPPTLLKCCLSLDHPRLIFSSYRNQSTDLLSQSTDWIIYPCLIRTATGSVSLSEHYHHN